MLAFNVFDYFLKLAKLAIVFLIFNSSLMASNYDPNTTNKILDDLNFRHPQFTEEELKNEKFYMLEDHPFNKTMHLLRYHLSHMEYERRMNNEKYSPDELATLFKLFDIIKIWLNEHNNIITRNKISAFYAEFVGISKRNPEQKKIILDQLTKYYHLMKDDDVWKSMCFARILRIKEIPTTEDIQELLRVDGELINPKNPYYLGDENVEMSQNITKKFLVSLGVMLNEEEK
jgi:hypothetical protein